MSDRRRYLAVPIAAGITVGAIASFLTTRLDHPAGVDAGIDAAGTSAASSGDALARWTFDGQIASFNAETADPPWSAAMSTRLHVALAQAAEPVSARIAMLECRRTLCRAEAEFPTYEAASARLAGFFSAIHVARCGKAYALVPPRDSGGPYRLPLLFACARDPTP